MKNQHYTEERYSIYCYSCPITSEIFYVGQDSKRGRRSREFEGHFHGKLKYKMRALLEQKLVPRITYLLRFNASEDPVRDLNLAEVFWIAEGKRRGWPLLNCTPGGKVTSGWPCLPETRAKISAGNCGKQRTPETLEKYRLAHTGKKASPETRAKMSTAHSGRAKSDAHKAAMAASWRVHHTEESFEKIAASKRGKSRDIETKNKISQKLKGQPWSDARRLAHERLQLSRRGIQNVPVIAQDDGALSSEVVTENHENVIVPDDADCCDKLT